MKKLTEILLNTKYKIVCGNTNITIRDIATDSRKVQKGDLFVALPGMTVDGHDFVYRAIENGAGAILVEENFEFEPNPNITAIFVENNYLAFAQISRAFFDFPADDLFLIGITGTNGKSTTTYMVESILKNDKAGVIGTLGYKYGEIHRTMDFTTPDSYELNRIFAEMRDAGVKTVIMEVSSHALAQKRTLEIKFDMAIFTNLTQDHLDFHKDMEDYFSAKMILFQSLKQDGKAIINIDDDYGKRVCKLVKPIITYGIENKDADYYADSIISKIEGSIFKVYDRTSEIEIQLQVPGIFNIYNSLAAFAATREYGFQETDIQKGLMEFTGIRGRFEMIKGQHDFNIIIDYAHTPDALETVTKEARNICQSKVITVFGAGGDRDKTKRPIMGSIVAESSDIIVLTSDNPRTEDPEEILNDIAKGIPENIEYYRISDRKKAIRAALDLAETSDIVVIAGKGHEDYQIIGHTKRHLDDKEVVHKWLEERDF
ncbi:MAG: UDP-N-acetylmuramoyl-L-alanyl-D-glutamate--2,6-diaminopimelate ligase [Candidatus Zixiibacteriota bacterium]